MQNLPLILFVEKKKTTTKQWKGSTGSRIQATVFAFPSSGNASYLLICACVYYLLYLFE